LVLYTVALVITWISHWNEMSLFLFKNKTRKAMEKKLFNSPHGHWKTSLWRFWVNTVFKKIKMRTELWRKYFQAENCLYKEVIPGKSM
jgi:hypothetical protein